MKLDVLYIDKDIIVVNKPSGVASSEERGASMDMMSYIRNYLYENDVKYEDVHVVHRLDKPVAGVMVYALNKKAAAALSKDIASKEAKKFYRAIVEGMPQKISSKNQQGKNSDIIKDDKNDNSNNNYGDEYIEVENVLLRDAKTNTSKIVESSTKDKNAKIAKLRFKICNEFEYNDMSLCMVDIELLTGRHHQIRVQFNGMGTPLYGDMKYNVHAKERNEREGVALCAYKLLIKHPTSGKVMKFEIVPSNSIFAKV